MRDDARTPADHPHYAVAEEAGRKLADAGFAVITGGGPGTMEAANRGASEAEAEAFLREFFEGYDVLVADSAPGALPGLDRPAAEEFVEAVGGTVNPKFGWTDVARFAALGVPAVNFGPGDPMLAHKQEEHVPVEHIERCERQLRDWLS